MAGQTTMEESRQLTEPTEVPATTASNTNETLIIALDMCSLTPIGTPSYAANTGKTTLITAR
jgi:hypothetical protein